ncbi:MAG: hypothetical protein PF450_07985, partial [Bacteroidales bacterium]|nr:hypothetical protein [Bacteroidales bacterium]
GKTKKRVWLMSAYAYQLAVKFNGIYLSEDKSTAIVYWQTSKYKKSFGDNLRYAVMFLRTLKLSKLFETAKREKFVEARRPKLDDYIYVWILGSDPSKTSIRGLADIRDHLYDLSKELNIPILMETTVEKLLKLYRYVGFEVYDEFMDETIGIPVYFMKKEIPEVK